MSEIGTIRLENHQNGHSVWILVHDKQRRYWLCVYSTSPGNRGYRFPVGSTFESKSEVVGGVPFTPSVTHAHHRGDQNV